jgi:hypothetical protein
VCFLKQQFSITIYHLLTKEKKLPFSVFFCRKQTGICRFHFPFAQTKGSCHFPQVPFLELQKHEDMDMETGETWKHGDMET